MTRAAEETPTNNGQFTVSLTQASSTDTVVTYTVAGTATAATDYTALTGTVTILAGETSAVIDVSGIVDDTLVEARRDRGGDADQCQRRSADHARPGTGRLTATVTIADNDSATVSIAANDATRGRDADQHRPVHGQPDPGELDRHGGHLHGGRHGHGGHRLHGADRHRDDPGRQTSAVIDVSGIVDDTLVEDSETVVVTLTSVSGDPQITPIRPQADDRDGDHCRQRQRHGVDRGE